jgi:hypothetical protein
VYIHTHVYPVVISTDFLIKIKEGSNGKNSLVGSGGGSSMTQPHPP